MTIELFSARAMKHAISASNCGYWENTNGQIFQHLPYYTNLPLITYVFHQTFLHNLNNTIIKL
ncbi:hypothetical protein AsAng_0048410 [Aureispira anguillae]|uniref:Uncharacterized protein n=1 Tax=Aureispira anguillae TaxID=2864201 RepID=A0A915YIZ1_9BACT|nr:hypothetical protein AsAng_0048410 [Aureispira anguillae]